MDQNQQDRQKQQLEELRGNLAKKAAYFKQVFNSPDGQKVLHFLLEEFDGLNLMQPGDPYNTSYNLGRRDVVKYIEQMVEFKHEPELVQEETGS